MKRRFDIKSLVRENILELDPYSSARDEFSGSASVFLDANENPYNTPLNRYPDPGQLELKRTIAGLKDQAIENLFLGNGSDEGIDLLFRVLCDPGKDNVITVDPTYGMYGVCAKINDVERRSVLLTDDFSLDAHAVLEAVDRNTKMIFLCSPNNPTANSLDRDALLIIIDNVNCVVVVDEAYIDFSSGQGVLSLLPEKQNLVVLQTLSKAWGLAGIRLGMLFAHPDLVRYLSGVKYPYNINALTLKEALAGLGDVKQAERWVSEILEERENMAVQLKSMDVILEVFPSDANFLLVKVEDPGRLYEFLVNRGIIVRDRSSVPLCEGCLRITVGSPEENRLLIETLRKYRSS
ncbi:MAG: histidinol-phosphate transaminase [Bacteroidales bacterium]|nr:histidinol-phosphate transaminase [Bacteroidales bacterium]